MKTLTKGQRFALAREARRLAMECVENGPQMIDLWCGCAAGIVTERAGLRFHEEDIPPQLDKLISNSHDALAYGVLSQATRERIFQGNPTAVVFPLLALADALEASAASASKTPSDLKAEVP